MEKKKTKLWKKILFSICIIIILSITIICISNKLYLYIDNEKRFNEFEKRQYIKTEGTLSYIEEDNYSKVENMDYITQDEIGVKIDSICIADDTFKTNINFKFNKEINYETFAFGYAVYDENNNIYAISSRMHIGENEKYDYDSMFMVRELGFQNDKNIYDKFLADRTELSSIEINENNNIKINQLKLEAKNQFPLSKKIYIKIFDLGYFNADKNANGEINTQNINLTDAKWLFEFDIPDEMNNKRNNSNIKLEMNNQIQGLEITDITLTESKLVIKFNSKEYVNLISEGKDMPSNEFREKCDEMLNITDGEGKKYQDIGGGTTEEENGFKIAFDATKNDLSKKLFINFKIGDKQYRSELTECYK